MSKIFQTAVCVLIAAIQIPAQESQSFDKIYEKTFIETAHQDMPKALKVADSLYNSSQDPIRKAKSLMLSANLYQQVGDFKKSIYFAENANSLIDETNDPNWQSMITVFLATQYRMVGLHERSKKYISEGLKIVKNIQDPQKYYKTFGLLNQEMTYYEIDLGDYQKAIDFAELSLKSFAKTDEKGTGFLISNSYQLLGESYFKVNNLKVSEQNYRKAEALLKEPTYLLGLVYSGLGGIRIRQKQWKEADFYLKKAEIIAEKSSHIELKKNVYANINDYYEGLGDTQKATLYAKKYVKAFSQADAKYNIEDNSQQPNSSLGKRSKMSIAKNITIIVLVVSLIWVLIFFKSKQKQKYSKFKHIIRNQQKSVNTISHLNNPVIEIGPDFSNISVEEIADNNEEFTKKRSESLMTSETEMKLLELLDDFEKGYLFNSKNMSLPFLAGELNTNTKYLSYIINQHKSSDFKSYINRLRINYIVDKINNDEKYRQYKISILADECGFSSHSKFASVFKAVTDFSPSAYIKLLDSENQKDSIHRV